MFYLLTNSDTATKIEAYGYFNNVADYSWSLLGMASMILVRVHYLPAAHERSILSSFSLFIFNWRFDGMSLRLTDRHSFLCTCPKPP